ncbi:MAG: hypothetical protein ACR2F1_02645 [Nitrososphaeraceae archaeon]
MTLPKKCSFSNQDTQCDIPPSYLLSVIENGEYLIGVSCMEHLEPIKHKIKKLQQNKTIPNGKLKVENIKMLSTNCIKGSQEDYEDVYSQRLREN